MIELRQLTGATFGPADLEVVADETVAVFAPSEASGKEFIDTLLGMAPPLAGHVKLLGTDLYALAENQRFLPLAGVGVVLEDGGLISNLKVWENILLPAEYHGHMPPEAEATVVAVLRECAYTDEKIAQFMGAAPDSLSLYEKRLTALLRLRLLDPPLCLYESIFDKLDAECTARLARLVDELHRARPGRTSLYTSTRAKSVQELPIQRVVRLPARVDT